MAELTTKYMGIMLRNPIIIGSSGLTKSIVGLKELENAGAGAVVLKSLFEEQIVIDTNSNLKSAIENNLLYTRYSDTFDYLDLYSRENILSDYLKFIRDAKKELVIPVIASINCFTPGEWFFFAKKIEEAGADAIELNLSVLSTNIDEESTVAEQLMLDIAKKVSATVKIPVSMKINPFFTNVAQLIKKLSLTGLKGLVLFNRTFNPDINLDNLEVIPANFFSAPSDMNYALRWIAIMSDKTKCDLVASSGIHNGDTIIKQLLVGAKAVQITSVIYKSGAGYITQMLNDIEKWMDQKKYNYMDQFIGKVNQYKSKDPGQYERIQFLRHHLEYTD